MDIAVRAARTTDIAAVAGLWREMDGLHAGLMPAYFRVPPASSAAAQVTRILGEANESLRVAERRGEVVGLVHVQIYDTPPQASLQPRRRAHVDSLIVVPSARRCGVGTRLVGEATSWAKARGADEVLLTVWAGNEAAERFYESLGFSRVNSVLARPI